MTNPNFGRPWSQAEDERMIFLRDHGCPFEDVAIELNRTVASCETRFSRLFGSHRPEERRRRRLLVRVDATVEIRERADKAREALRKAAADEISEGMDFAQRFHRMNVAGSAKLLQRLRMAQRVELIGKVAAKPEPVKPRFVALQDAWGL